MGNVKVANFLSTSYPTPVERMKQQLPLTNKRQKQNKLHKNNCKCTFHQPSGNITS